MTAMLKHGTGWEKIGVRLQFIREISGRVPGLVSSAGDYRAGKSRPGVAGGLGFVVVGIAVHDQALSNDIGHAAAHGNHAGLKAEFGYTGGIGLQVGQVARMVRARAVAAMRRTGGVEVSTSAHAVTAGAIAFFMHMKTVFGVGFEAAHFTTDQYLAADLYKSNAAAGGVADGRLQLRAGARGGRCAGAGAQQSG